MTESRTKRAVGKVRAARLTDLAALGELSRLCQSDSANTRSLGLPAHRTADRRVQPVPAAAGRLPAERPHVRLRGGGPHRGPRPRGARERPRRVDDPRARCGRDGRCRRHPLPARPAAAARGREARRRPASTSPAPTPTATSSCSCRPASSATARSRSCPRPAGLPLPAPWPDERAAELRDPPDDAPRCARPQPAVCDSDAARRSPASRPSGSPTGSARARTGGCRARA